MYFLTPWVRRLLIANIAIFALSSLMPSVQYYGALIPVAVMSRPWTVVTYMFLHAGFGHIFFNMLGLFVFGPRIEQRIGGWDFLKLYFLGGLGGAALSFVFTPNAPVVGASAAVYAVCVAFAMYWPRERLYIYGIFPIEAWLAITLLVIYSVWSGISNPGSGVADFAHLGGIGFGFAFMKWREWRRGSPKREFQRQVTMTPSATASDDVTLQRWESIKTAHLHELNRHEVNLLLQRARSLGVRGLTPAERGFLDRMATQN